MTAPRQQLRDWRPLYTRPRPVSPALHLAETNGVLVRRESPRWLAVLDGWYAARREALPVALDTATATIITAALLDEADPSRIIAAAAGFLAGGLLAGLWKPRSCVEAQGIGWAVRPLALAAAAGAAPRLASGAPFDRVATATALALAALLVIRTVLWAAIGAARRRGFGLRPALVVGPRGWTTQIRHRMSVFPDAGLYCDAATDTDDVDHAEDAVDRAILAHHPSHIIVADPSPELLRRVIHVAEGRADCSLVAPVKGLAASVRIGDVGLVPLRLRPGWGTLGAKRVFDVLASALLLILASPLMALTALAVRLGDGGPVLFCQPRVGREGRTFTCYKFRSMVVGADERRLSLADERRRSGLLFKLERDPRVTTIGKVIRRLAIDELPQLANVLRGDMSLVGPRPLPVDPSDFETDARSRHHVPPGITGLWQVHGGNALRYPDMIDLDLAYLASHSLALDIVVLARTVPALLVRRAPC